MDSSDRPPPSTRPTDLTKRKATFEEVDIRSELSARPQRTPDYAAEHRAMKVLTAEMTANPRNMLQMVETALDLCPAEPGSAYWRATSFAGRLWRGIRRLSRFHDAT
jgi:hypothetical protein